MNYVNIYQLFRYWQKKKWELQAMVENVGPFTKLFYELVSGCNFRRHFSDGYLFDGSGELMEWD